MPLPKLSPLQSRLAASLIASIMLLLLYFTFSSPHFAYAIDVDSILREDHNHDRLLDGPFLDFEFDELELRDVTYEAEFLGVDRGIIGRATTDPTALINNRADVTNIQQGQLVSYMFSNASLWADKSPPSSNLPSQISLQGRSMKRAEVEYELDNEIDADTDRASDLKPRQSSPDTQRTLYITVTTCLQPSPISNTTTDPAPQLQLYVSQSQNNTTPGPGQSPQDMVPLVNGYALYELNATGDVFIGVYGENVNTTYSDVWNAQIAASIDQPYHYYWNSTNPNLFLVDSDSNSALLFTGPLMTNSSDTTLLEKWMDMSPPFAIFASDSSDKSIMGVQNSFCGLQNNAQIAASRPGQTTTDIDTSMTSIGSETLPRQQFYMNGLSPGKNYSVMLALPGTSVNSSNQVIGGGGQVFRLTSFNTLSDGNCAVIYNLSFCDQTAYAVPSNPNSFPNMTALAAYYDNTTQSLYTIFQNVLAQIPCETTSSAQYSLARNCADCAAAYKAWLCAVSIPRCTDFTSDASYLQPRAMGQPFPNGTFLDAAQLAIANQSLAVNNSRSPLIDQNVTPGPYKEVLPCDDLCYNLVQSCPASMQFSCPRQGNIGFNESYGVKPLGGQDANGIVLDLTCNFPGQAYYLATGSSLAPPLALMLISVAFCMIFL